jgi:hypothetical protein
MLEIKLQGSIENEPDQIVLEHSLISMSKWESIYEKPFLTMDKKTDDETLGYIYQMIVSDPKPTFLKNRLSKDSYEKIADYISSKQTATWFADQTTTTPNSGLPPKDVVTAELIYFWMFSFGIPKECESWHVNRLLTLIKVFEAHNRKEEKRSAHDMAADRTRLNAERRAMYGTEG